jgi:hypothetical protein
MNVRPRWAAANNNGDMETVSQSEERMTGRGGAGRLGAVVLATVIVIAGCRDNGLPDRNLPLEEARHRTYGYPAYENLTDHPQVAVAGRHWMPGLPVERIPDRMLVPVGGDGTTQLYALRGAEAPYSRLYARAGAGEWRPFLRLN